MRGPRRNPAKAVSLGKGGAAKGASFAKNGEASGTQLATTLKGHAANPCNNRCDELAVSQWQKLKGCVHPFGPVGQGENGTGCILRQSQEDLVAVRRGPCLEGCGLLPYRPPQMWPPSLRRENKIKAFVLTGKSSLGEVRAMKEGVTYVATRR